jgi:hypothetical protein
VERPEVEPKESWPQKKVKCAEVNINDEEKDEMVEDLRLKRMRKRLKRLMMSTAKMQKLKATNS